MNLNYPKGSGGDNTLKLFPNIICVQSTYFLHSHQTVTLYDLNGIYLIALYKYNIFYFIEVCQVVLPNSKFRVNIVILNITF